MRLPISLAIAALAVAAPPAHAAWSTPEALDVLPATAPLLSPAAGGGATLIFKSDLVAARATVGADRSARAVRRLPVGYTAAAADARGRALLARVDDGVLRVRTVAPHGRLGPRVVVLRNAFDVELAVNRAGDAVLAAVAGNRLFAATGNTRSGFGPARRLSARRAGAFATAVNRAGDALVAFTQSGRLLAADRRAGAKRFGAARDLGPSAPAESPELDVALGAGGAALAAYTDGREFVAATRARRGAWGDPQRLEDGLTGRGLRPDVELLGDTAVLAYVAEGGVAKLAQGPAGGRLAPPVALGEAPARAMDVAVAAGGAGDLAVLWVEDFVARGAVQPAGGSLGAPQVLDTGRRSVLDVAVVDGGAGRFLAAIETGRRWKGSRDIRLTAFAP